MQFIWPLDDYVLTRGFYYLSSLYVGGQHAAVDLIRRLATTTGAPIRAVANGTVAGVGWDMYSGFFVAVDHVDGWRSWYRHLYGQTPVVVGQRVARGQIIGNVGNTGASQGAHLHFDLWHRGKHDPTAFAKHGIWAHNPELYLGKGNDDMLTDEQHAMLQTVHHFAKISGPAVLSAILVQTRAANAQAKAANAKCARIEQKLAALAVDASGAHSH